MEKVELYKDYSNNDLKVIKTITNIDDFMEVISVFKEAPYYEILDKNAIEEEYETYKQNGLALGFYLNDKIAGLNCLVYKGDPKHSILFSRLDNIAYYSGFAVKPNYRKIGIGKLLISETDKYLQSLKLFDYSYARILINGSMSEGIFKLYGFTDAYYNNELIVDDVEYKRNKEDVEQVDVRKYMVKKLSNQGHGFIKR